MQQVTSKTCPGTSPCYRSTCSVCAQVELSLEHSAMLNCSLEFSVFSLPYLSCRKWQGSSTHVWHHMLPLRHVIDNREGRHIGFERASWMASVDRSFLDGKRSERSLCSVKGREVIWKSREEGSVSQRETGEALSWGTLPLRLWAPCTNLGAKHSSCLFCLQWFFSLVGYLCMCTKWRKLCVLHEAAGSGIKNRRSQTGTNQIVIFLLSSPSEREINIWVVNAIHESVQGESLSMRNPVANTGYVLPFRVVLQHAGECKP